MKAGSVRRLGAAAVLLVCVVVLPGQAIADGAQTLTLTGPNEVPESGIAQYTVTLSAGTDADADVSIKTMAGSATEGVDYSSTPAMLTVVAGTPTTFDVSITSDDTVEPNESFSVELSEPQRAVVGTGSVTTAILNDDNPPPPPPPPSISIDDAEAPEGNDVAFTISLSAASTNPVTVSYATADGSAGGADYNGVSPTPVTFDPGQTSKTVTVTTKEDALDEEDETFTVTLSNASNATINDGSGIGKILDDDNPPSISIGDVTVTEGDPPGTVAATFNVTLSAVSGKAIAVDYSTGEGTATTADFVPKSGTLPIPTGSAAAAITVEVKGDTLSEAEEQFFVNLFGPVNATVADNQATGKITDNDVVPAPTFDSFTHPAEGNAGIATLALSLRLGPHAASTTFDYRLVAGTATPGADYQIQGSTSVTFPPSGGEITRPITVGIVGDTLDEVDETFTVEVVKPADGTVVATAPVTIRNDDNNSKLSISDSTADEPSTGTATMKFTVTLSPASGRAVSVNWATANGTATAGVDYTAGSGALNFTPGQTSKEISITVIGDTINEENEMVLVNLSGPSGAGFAAAGAQGQGTIIDKNAPPSLSISDTVTRENGTGAAFTVTLAGTTLRTVTVRFSTSDGTAKAGSDYVARVGTLAFASGEKTKAIAVTVVDDTAAESSEDFSVGLGDPVNATITKNRGTASIEASDQAPTTPRSPNTLVVKPVAKTTTLLPRMLLGPRTVTIAAAGVARMLVTCHKASPIACSGSVALETVAKPKLQLGKKTFSVKKGKKVYVPIKLSARSLGRLKLKGTLKAKAIVVVKTGTKTLRVVPGVITLKLKPGTKFKAPATKVVIDKP